jgi:hypothetical protein
MWLVSAEALELPQYLDEHTNPGFSGGPVLFSVQVNGQGPRRLRGTTPMPSLRR